MPDKMIVLEPGHSGSWEAGVKGEKDWAHSLSVMILDGLSKHNSIGCHVVDSWYISREPDPIVSKENDLYLSLHYNSGGVPHGYMWSVPSEGDAVSVKSKRFGMIWARRYWDATKIPFKNTTTDNMRYNYAWYFVNKNTPKCILDFGNGVTSDYDVLHNQKPMIASTTVDSILEFLTD